MSLPVGAIEQTVLSALPRESVRFVGKRYVVLGFMGGFGLRCVIGALFIQYKKESEKNKTELGGKEKVFTVFFNRAVLAWLGSFFMQKLGSVITTQIRANEEQIRANADKTYGRSFVGYRKRKNGARQT